MRLREAGCRGGTRGWVGRQRKATCLSCDAPATSGLLCKSAESFGFHLAEIQGFCVCVHMRVNVHVHIGMQVHACACASGERRQYQVSFIRCHLQWVVVLLLLLLLLSSFSSSFLLLLLFETGSLKGLEFDKEASCGLLSLSPGMRIISIHHHVWLSVLFHLSCGGSNSGE